MMQSEFTGDLLFNDYDSMPITSSPTGTTRTINSMPTSRATSRVRSVGGRSNPRASPIPESDAEDDAASSEPTSVSPVPVVPQAHTEYGTCGAAATASASVEDAKVRETVAADSKLVADELRALLEEARQEVQQLKDQNAQQHKRWNAEKGMLEGKVDALTRHIKAADNTPYQPLLTDKKENASCCTIL